MLLTTKSQKNQLLSGGLNKLFELETGTFAKSRQPAYLRGTHKYGMKMPKTVK